VDLTVDTSGSMAGILNEPTKGRLLELTAAVDLQSAPTLPWEIGNALSALFKRGRIEMPQATSALRSFQRIPIRFAEVELADCVALAREQDIYAYDAYILECARRYRTPLLSLDGPQCRRAQGLGITVLEV